MNGTDEEFISVGLSEFTAIATAEIQGLQQRKKKHHKGKGKPRSDKQDMKKETRDQKSELIQTFKKMTYKSESGQ